MECRSDTLYFVMWGSSILGRYVLVIIFSIGLVIVMSLECEVVLFHLVMAETEQGVALAILRCVIDFKREPWPQISESAKSLVRQMLEPDPRKRLTAQQVLGKSYLSSGRSSTC